MEQGIRCENRVYGMGEGRLHLFYETTHSPSPSAVCTRTRLDNAVAESFFSALKKLRIRRWIYTTRDDARADIFDFIELFYNSQETQSRRRRVPAAV